MKYKILENEFIDVYGMRLFRIEALENFSVIKKGDKGGYIMSEQNLDQSGEAWVSGEARVSGEADIIVITNLGSRNSALTAIRQKDGLIGYATGCFYGTENDFLTSIKERHGDNRYAIQYRAAIHFINSVILKTVPVDIPTIQ